MQWTVLSTPKRVRYMPETVGTEGVREKTEMGFVVCNTFHVETFVLVLVSLVTCIQDSLNDYQLINILEYRVLCLSSGVCSTDY